MALPADWQAQIAGGPLLGAGTDYIIEGPITGLGVPAPRTSDLAQLGGGAFGGRDMASTRTIAIPVAVATGDPVTTWTAVDTLCAAWEPTSTNTTLDVRLPGMGTKRWTGRPRGATLDLDLLPAGAARVLLTFEALVPEGATV